MSDEKPNVIQFPGGQPEEPSKPEQEEAASTSPSGGPLGGLLGGQLSPDQEKALQIIMSGMSFVCLGIKPTESGADFFTAVDGDAGELSDAQPHLDGVIERAMRRKGLI